MIVISFSFMIIIWLRVELVRMMMEFREVWMRLRWMIDN